MTSLELLSVAPSLATRDAAHARALSGQRRRPLARGGAGQNHARAPSRRDGARRRGAALALLRHRRRHAAVAGAARRELALARRSSARRGAVAQRRARARLDRAAPATRRRLRALSARARQGAENQGWKDCRDGVSFPDGAIAPAPIALVEVQGYVVGALEAMAMLFARVGAAARADPDGAGGALRRRIHEASGCARPASTRSPSTARGAGADHHLEPGAPALLRRAARASARRGWSTCSSPTGVFSGWGVRTLARGQAVYNPLSYHNGSVWPHDNALCALGAARTVAATRRWLFEGLYDASLHFRHLRLPELFCGLGRGEGDFLVHYPVSCSPQAWASGAFFLLLQACLGLEPDAARAHAHDSRPAAAGASSTSRSVRSARRQARVSLHFSRHESRTHCDVLEVTGDRLRVNIEF